MARGDAVQVNTPALYAGLGDFCCPPLQEPTEYTSPTGRELASLPGAREMRSLTKFGLSQVPLQFNDDVDIYRARQLVTERLQGLVEQLSTEASPQLAPISTGLGEISYYSLSYRDEAPNKPGSERDELIALAELQEYVVKPFFARCRASRRSTAQAATKNNS